MRDGVHLTFPAVLCIIALALGVFGQIASRTAAEANLRAAQVNAAAMQGLLDGLRTLRKERQAAEAEARESCQ